ncbi:MAG: hypothetical protein HUU45_12215 [Leptospiraceae bacterium]|nr:hypothetical protein [Leptospiraceae bacterium]
MSLQKKLLPENLVKQWWFNSGSLIDQHFKGTPSLTSKKLVYYNQSRGNTQISYRQGASLEDFLIKTGRWYSQLICTSHPAITIGEAQITILSPTESVLSKLSENWADYFKEKKDTQINRREHDFNTSIEELARRSYIRDPSLVNQSSIAFLFELKGTRLIFLADATPEIYLAALKKLIEVRNLKKLAINAVKLAHHAGKHNFLPELLDLIDCQHFLISTDGSRHMLPNKETLAKIILHPERQPGAHTFFHFNYKNTLLQHIFDKNIALLHNFQCVFPVPSENGSNLEWNDD